jgi:hypothetical protein
MDTASPLPPNYTPLTCHSQADGKAGNSH